MNRSLTNGNSEAQSPVGCNRRPVGQLKPLLEDLKFRGLACGAMMDVGANSGLWSRVAKEVFPEAGISLIEPRAEMKPDLERFCAAHPDSRYFLVGAGEQKATMPLTVHGEDSTFVPGRAGEKPNWGEQRDVEVVTVDSLVNERGCLIPDLMKVDVQGLELEVLKGASSTFGKTEIYILEVSFFPFYEGMPIFYDVVHFMQERNYVAYDFAGFLRRDYDGALGQCDICFVKENGFLRESNAW